jgi:hypothetical protein
MKRTICLVIAGAVIPFFVPLVVLPGFQTRLSEGPGYLPFCLVAGSCWTAVFLVILARSAAAERARLLWLSPLALFAFNFPVMYPLLWVMFAVSGANGNGYP